MHKRKEEKTGGGLGEFTYGGNQSPPTHEDNPYQVRLDEKQARWIEYERLLEEQDKELNEEELKEE